MKHSDSPIFRNLPTFKNPKVIRQFLEFSEPVRALWLSSMAFTFLVASISEDEDEYPDVVERKCLELTGFALGLPKADIAATIKYIQKDKDQCQN
jgi:hypothetical protein